MIQISKAQATATRMHALQVGNYLTIFLFKVKNPTPQLLFHEQKQKTKNNDNQQTLRFEASKYTWISKEPKDCLHSYSLPIVLEVLKMHI